MDKIRLKNMVFYGYHGVLEEEKSLGQRFEVDLEVRLSLKEAGERDELDLTVDYRTLYKIAKEVMEGKKYNLLEKAAEEIARLVSLACSEEEIIVTIRKPNVPLGGVLDYAEVEIVRGKDHA